MFAQIRRCVALIAVTCCSAAAAHADAPSGNATVPDVVGLMQPEAEALLRRANFPLRVENVEQADLPPGLVVSQDPGGLAVRPNDTTIVVRVVGTKPQPAPVEPPVVAPTPTPPAEPPPSLPPSGELPSVPPSEPAPAPSGELAPPAVVPAAPTPSAAPALPGLTDVPQEAGLDTNGPPLANTFGLAQQEAERKLAGYQVLTEVTLTSADMQGRVVEQHPEPGTTLALGQPVTLIFGLANEPGPEYRQVPALEGLGLEEAQAKLAKVGYAMVVSSVPSPNEKAGLVVSTTPHRFSFLLKGETVRVRIGRGTGASLPPPATEAAPTPPNPLPPSGALPPREEPLPAPPPVETPPTPAEPLPPTAAPPAEPPPVEPPPVLPPPVEPPPTGPVEPPAQPLPAPTPVPAQPPRPAPGACTLSGPAEGDSFPRAYGPTFEWVTVPNADGYEWQLEQEVAEGWRQVRTETLLGTKFRPAQLGAGRYRWRVRALSGDVPGPWAEYRRLFLY